MKCKDHINIPDDFWPVSQLQLGNTLTLIINKKGSYFKKSVQHRTIPYVSTIDNDFWSFNTFFLEHVNEPLEALHWITWCSITFIKNVFSIKISCHNSSLVHPKCLQDLINRFCRSSGCHCKHHSFW